MSETVRERFDWTQFRKSCRSAALSFGSAALDERNLKFRSESPGIATAAQHVGLQRLAPCCATIDISARLYCVTRIVLTPQFQ